MTRLRLSLLLTIVALGIASPALAQRQLHWDRLDVEATLDPQGTISIVETQTMVFSGDWNGGERGFDIRPWQTLRFHAILRERDGVWRQLAQDSSLDEVDEFGWSGDEMLRWRSRLPADPPFSNTVIRYQLHYSIDGVLNKNEDGYVLDHNFVFPEREGEIRAFSLKLTLDPAWQATSAIEDRYTAGPVAPGDGFRLTVPLRFVGSGDPAAFDVRRPPEVLRAMQVLIAGALLIVGWLFIREILRGRFAPLPVVEDEAWLRQHVLAHPAEVVGAAWDDGIGQSEVVALLARMVAEKKLSSNVKSKSSLALTLEVDRESLDGYERQLIDKLFFDGRTHTNTDTVKKHYRQKGFNPVDEIRAGLVARLDTLLPTGQTFIPGTLVGVLMLVSAVLLVMEWMGGRVDTAPAAAVGFGGMFLTIVGASMGHGFRGALHRGPVAALRTFIPAVIAVALAYWFLRSYIDLGYPQMSPQFAAAIVAMALGTVVATAAAMRSRQRAEGVAVRKRLTAARGFFERELQADRPALKDEWFPWLLAFGLSKEMDDWSVRNTSSSRTSRSSSTTAASSWSSGDSSTGSSSGGWTGFAGGRSGGAGASGTWALAAGSMAAGVSPPSSSGSSSGGSSSSSSSGGGSSGGGSGGGW